MEKRTTLLFNPNNAHEPPKRFTFDYSYWSHDGFVENSDGFCERDPSHPNGSIYADQVSFVAPITLYLPLPDEYRFL